MSTCAGPEKRPGRIACIQLDSKHADVPRNIETALRLGAGLIADRFADPVDLVVLPELALTGYVFESREELDPLLEDSSTFSPPRPISGPALSSDAAAFISACRSSCVASDHPSLNLAAHVAQQLQCHVVIGFPERGSPDHDQAIRATAAGATAVSAPYDARPIEHRAEPTAIEARAAYNSAALMAPDGSLLHVFRKHFLFETDEKWAVQGSGFQTLRLPALGTVCVAICMDLNPFRFTAPFEAYELASFCVEHDVDLLVMPMAWLAPSDERHQLESDQAAAPPQPSLSTINYWALRCKPFFQPPKPPVPPAELGEDRLHKQRYLITANRVGRERDSIFGGSSCVLQMKPNERPLLVECLNSAEEACLVTTLPR
jgi:protein N-terminal amidase